MFTLYPAPQRISPRARSKTHARLLLVEALEFRRLLSGYSASTVASFGDIGLKNPSQTIVRDTAGDVFGIANGGANSDGAVWKLAAGANALSVVASFDGTNGTTPTGGILMDGGGNLYGICWSGGAHGNGTLWEIVSGSSTITVLGSFDSTTAINPTGQIYRDASGDIFGTAQGPLSGNGNIWEYNANTSAITDVADFTNGANPMGGVISDGNGKLFGTTFNGGANGEGTIFEYQIGGSTITTLASFNGASTGGNPKGGLAIDAGGDLFGTSTGDVNSPRDSNVWELPSGSSTINTLAFFPVPHVSFFAGAAPAGPVSLDSNGDLLGTSEFGGSTAQGSVWEIPKGTQTLLTLYSPTFSGGHDPGSSLLIDNAGDILSTMQMGGTGNNGTVFMLIPPNAVAPTHLAFTVQPVNTASDGDFTADVHVTVEGAGNQPATANTSAITLTIDKGPGTLGGTVTVNAVDGVATFTGLTLDASGTYMLKATAGALASAVSKSFIVPTIAHLAIAQQPEDITAGTRMATPISINMLDQFGMLLTANHSQVKLTLSSGPTGAKLTGFSAPVIHGVATFTTLTATRAGTYTLSAGDGAMAALPLDPFNVNAAVASKMIFSTLPAAVTVATSFDVKVELLDKYGNIAAADASTVTLSLKTHPLNASLAGTLSQSVATGTADFADLTVNAAGPYTLLATDSNHISTAISAKFAASA